MASFGANCVRLRIFVKPNGRRLVVNELVYTLRTFAEHDVLPELVQIRNEIDHGLLWAVGKIWKKDAKSPNGDSVATLL